MISVKSLSVVSAKIMTDSLSLNGFVRTCLCAFSVLCASCHGFATVLVLIYICFTCSCLSIPGQLLLRIVRSVKIVFVNCHFCLFNNPSLLSGASTSEFLARFFGVGGNCGVDQTCGSQEWCCGREDRRHVVNHLTQAWSRKEMRERERETERERGSWRLWGL